MLKSKIFKIIFCMLILINIIFNVSFGIEAITVPEDNINLKIENLTRGCNVYLLLSENLLKYNMEKFISNNTNNPYSIQAEEAEDLRAFLANNDYVGYVNYFKELGFNQEKTNEVEVRHYCIAMGEAEVIGEIIYNNLKYVQVGVDIVENETKAVRLYKADSDGNLKSCHFDAKIDRLGQITSKSEVEL